MERDRKGSLFSSRAFGSAPLESKACTTSGSCRCTAECSGARPAPLWLTSAPLPIRKRAISECPLSIATIRADASVPSRKMSCVLVSPPMPSGADSFTSTPAANNILAMSTFPCCAAKSNGENPFVLRVRAPPAVSRMTRATAV